MKMEKWFGINMRIVASSISRKNIPLLKQTIMFCESKGVDELIILLHGEISGQNSIVEKNGLRELIEELVKHSRINIHLVREGLGFNLSVKDYNEIFSNTRYHIETTYTCKWDDYNLTFQSNNQEDFYWNDQFFSDLQKQAKEHSSIRVSSVDKPNHHFWGEDAWKLSTQMDSKLLYLEDGDTVLFDKGSVYKLDNQKIVKIKEYKK